MPTYVRTDRCDGCKGRKDRPPDDGKGQHAAWPPAIPQPSTGNLKEGVPKNEGRKNLSHLQVGESECRHHLAGGDGNIHPIDVGDNADEEEQEKNPPADSRRGGGRRRRVHEEYIKQSLGDSMGKLPPLAFAWCVS